MTGDDQNPRASQELLSQLWSWDSDVNIPWELVRYGDFPAPLVLLSQNLHFNKAPDDSNVH